MTAHPAPLSALAWPQVPAGATVLVPMGATEQHGPHLPLDTDTLIATAVARAAAAELAAGRGEPPVVVAPALNYGASGEHQAFPGTMSLGRGALLSVLVELTRSLAGWAGRVVFVNGHGGNVATLADAVGQLIYEGHEVGWVPAVSTAVDAHAGRTETSLMLHLAPWTVALDRAAPGATAPVRELMPALVSGGVAAVSPSGVLGDPSGASAREGASLLEAAVQEVLARVAGRPDGRGCLQPRRAAP